MRLFLCKKKRFFLLLNVGIYATIFAMKKDVGIDPVEPDSGCLVSVDKKKFCSNRDNVVAFLHLAYATAALVRAEVFNRGKNNQICVMLREMVKECHEYVQEHEQAFYAFRPAFDALIDWQERIRELLNDKRAEQFNGKAFIPPLCLGNWELLPKLSMQVSKMAKEDVAHLYDPYLFNEEFRANVLGCPSYANCDNACAIS